MNVRQVADRLGTNSRGLKILISAGVLKPADVFRTGEFALWLFSPAWLSSAQSDIEAHAGGLMAVRYERRVVTVTPIPGTIRIVPPKK